VGLVETMKALTVRQPWAWLLFHGKDVENRDWPARHRGLLAIHAGKGITRREYDDAVCFVERINEVLAMNIPQFELITRGAVLGTVRMVDCVEYEHSPWFQGQYGFVFENATEFSRPIPCNGALGFWDWELPPNTANAKPQEESSASPEAKTK